jgi:hypothetical protein
MGMLPSDGSLIWQPFYSLHASRRTKRHGKYVGSGQDLVGGSVSLSAHRINHFFAFSSFTEMQTNLSDLCGLFRIRETEV